MPGGRQFRYLTEKTGHSSSSLWYRNCGDPSGSGRHACGRSPEEESAMSSSATRLEHDLLGDKAVPADAYYGVQTARALENFHISGVHAAALSQSDQGVRDGEDGRGARQLRLRAVQQGNPDGHRGRLPGNHRRASSTTSSSLDVFQGGAGTSTNMNANEVIANRALELMGHRKGEYKHCDPARSRQLLAVDQRRLSVVAARRHGARQPCSSWPR